MEKMIFRDLRAEEVLVRLQSKYNNRGLFLIYKDARVDMNILNERVGMGFWKREHFAINNYLCCRVSIYNDKLESWVSCEDVGEEQTFEKVKSVFSDSFKRACFNFGIGIELYTAPKIVIDLKSGDLDAKGNLKNSFFVSEIETVNKVIQKLVIKDSQNNIRFTYDLSKQVIDYNKIPNGKNKGKLWKDCDIDTLNKALDFYTNKEKNEKYIKIIEPILEEKLSICREGKDDGRKWADMTIAELEDYYKKYKNGKLIGFAEERMNYIQAIINEKRAMENKENKEAKTPKVETNEDENPFEVDEEEAKNWDGEFKNPDELGEDEYMFE